MSIKIIGDEHFVQKTQAALDLLDMKAHRYYEFVLDNIGVIEFVNKGSGMWAWEKPPRFTVGKATVEAGPIWLASTMVHDANHSKQYQDYLSKHPECGDTVPPEAYTGEESERECLKLQRDVLKQLDAPQKTLDYIDKVISTEYWKGSYEDRSW